MTLRGELTDITIVDILQLLQGARKTGELRVHGPIGEARLSFREGRVTASKHPSDGVQIGRFLIDMKAVRQSDIDDALAHQAAAGANRKPLVGTLVSLGRLQRSAGHAATSISAAVSWKRTVKAGSWRSRLASSRRVSNFDRPD